MLSADLTEKVLYERNFTKKRAVVPGAELTGRSGFLGRITLKGVLYGQDSLKGVHSG